MPPTVPARVLLAASALLLAAPTVLTGLAVASAAPAQDATATAAASERLKLVNEVLHQVQVAKPEAASDAATALLATGITPAELADLIDTNQLGERFDRVMTRGRGLDGFSTMAAELEQAVRQGRLDLARRPDRIEQSIELLGGTLRQQMYAAERIAAADEFAMPALLKLLASGDPAKEIAAAKQIRSLGRYAVQPLCAALPKLDPGMQRQAAEILGDLGYSEARGPLLALAGDAAATSDVRQAAAGAAGRIGGAGTSPSAAFTALARRYFDGDAALVMHPDDATSNVWSFDAFGGLVATPVPTPIFLDVMTMRSARAALALDPSDADALAFYLAGDLRRGNHLPPGESDPVFGDNRYSAEFFATAAGPTLAESVLALAIDRRDTALALDAIRALAATGGRSVTMRGGRAPLVEGLRYPDRRVQIESALAIVDSDPQQSFSGDFSVVPILASAVRDSGTRFASVVAANDEDRNALAAAASALGFTTLTGGETFGQLEAELARESGLDLLLVQGDSSFVSEAIRAARGSRFAPAVPVLAVTDGNGAAELTRFADSDRGTVVWLAGSPDATFRSAVESVLARQSGGAMAPDEGLEYAVRSIDALKKVALRGGRIFNLADAQPALLAALGKSGGMRMIVADVVAMVPTAESQRALVAAAFAADDEMDTVDLLDRAAASARLHGRLADEAQIARLRSLIEKSEGAVADAAGRLYGALDLPVAEVVNLIVR